MLKSWKTKIVGKTSRLGDLAWVVARPKLVYDWYRMWGTLPVTSWLRAADHFIQKDFKLAAEYYRVGLSRQLKHPARHCARMDLAYCQYRTGDIKEALEQLGVVTEASVALRDAYVLKAKIEDILGKSELSLQTLRDGLTLFPQDLRILVAFVHISLFNRIEHARLSEARGLLLQQKRELFLDDNRQVLLDAALAHYEIRVGDTESGDRMLARVLATGIAPVEAIVLRGMRLLEQRRMIQAREQLGRAMRLAPRSSRPVRILAESYLMPGDFCELDWAEQMATAACKLSAWQNRECVEVLAKVMDTKGDASTAELLTERSLDLTRQLRVEFEVAAKRRSPAPRQEQRRGEKLEA